jgi:hypothetical protein
MEDRSANGRITLKMDFKEIGRKGVNWNHLAQGREKWLTLANTVTKAWVPQKAELLD